MTRNSRRGITSNSAEETWLALTSTRGMTPYEAAKAMFMTAWDEAMRSAAVIRPDRVRITVDLFTKED